MASYPISSTGCSPAHSTARASLDEPIGNANPLSTWSDSRSKRLFDLVCVIFSLPIVTPLLLLSILAVRLTSRGPVLFRQERMGRGGRPFTIYKFRTMPVCMSSHERPNVTTLSNQRFTLAGPFLRRWKLDELPQIFNVLRGDMSLVGPRPKVPEHQLTELCCRPGVTGSATFLFAREEILFAGLSEDELSSLNNDFVLPLKEQLDREYMATASCASDLRLILKSIFRKWDDGDFRNSIRSPLFGLLTKRGENNP